jgi:hypothetical protein
MRNIKYFYLKILIANVQQILSANIQFSHREGVGEDYATYRGQIYTYIYELNIHS